MSESTLLEILRIQDVHPDFLNVVQSIAAKVGVSIGDADCGYRFWLRSPGRIQFSYTFKYPEKREGRDESWTLRRTSVYQCVVPKERHSCWILLHPMHDSPAYLRLSRVLSDKDKAEELFREPLKQHVLLMSEYLPNWEPFFNHYERVIESIANTVAGHTFTDRFEPTPPDYLIKLRVIENDTLLPLLSVFNSYADTLHGLQELNRALCEELCTPLDDMANMDCALRNLHRQNEAHLRTVQFLVGRVSRLAQLLRDTHMIHNQTVVREQTVMLTSLNKLSGLQNKEIHRISTASLRESSAVKIIALVTLGFLPIQVVGTIFGSQVVFLNQSRSLALSPDSWIMFTVAALVTILTMGYWFIHQWKENSRFGLGHSSHDDAAV